MSILGINGVRALIAASLASLLAASCLYDPDHRCGPSQHLGPNSTCACDNGLVFSGQSCVPCPDNENWQSGVCVCNDGYTRADVDGGVGVCVLGGPGTSCDPTEVPTTQCTMHPIPRVVITAKALDTALRHARTTPTARTASCATRRSRPRPARAPRSAKVTLV